MPKVAHVDMLLCPTCSRNNTPSIELIQDSVTYSTACKGCKTPFIFTMRSIMVQGVKLRLFFEAPARCMAGAPHIFRCVICGEEKTDATHVSH